MLNQFLKDKIITNLTFTPNQQQSEAIESLADFLFLRNSNTLFLLLGYAGTGKTSILGAFVKTLLSMEQKIVLMAPTGRAAKVLAFHSDYKASTIHKKIYIQKSFTGDYSNFVLNRNLHRDTIFIVDEASMINNNSENFSMGSGRLLDDLIKYVYSAENCRLLLIGDNAQLPPIGSDFSAALSVDALECYGMDVYSSLLTEVSRQKGDSGILYNATKIREELRLNNTYDYPQIAFDGFKDIKIIKGEDLIDEISSRYTTDGLSNTMIITRSNKRANLYNQGVRNSILYREDEISAGDIIIVSKNNYHWCKAIKEIDFIANGEILEVRRTRNFTDLYGLRFCDVELRSLDQDVEFEAKLVLDSLHSDSASLSNEVRENFLKNLMKDYDDIPNSKERMKLVKENPHFNALQAKFAYAITCHKAQGGEWQNIFIDIGYITEEQMGVDFYRWLYTAITRSTNQLFFVNLSDDFISVEK